MTEDIATAIADDADGPSFSAEQGFDDHSIDTGSTEDDFDS
ncbi:MAG: hypothetical protein ABIO83_10620 [Ilumatobacteraceae bacterium]